MILTDHMVNRLLIPLYIYSLPSKDDLVGEHDPDRVHISKLVALFLLAQVSSYMSPLVWLNDKKDFSIQAQLYAKVLENNNCYTFIAYSSSCVKKSFNRQDFFRD